VSHWRRVRLGDVCELNPRRPPLTRPDDQPTSFLPMAAIAEAGRGIQRMIERPFAEVRKGYTFVDEGDVLFARITPCMQNGKHAIARGLLDGIAFASTEFHVLRPRSEAVIAEWVHSFLLMPDVLSAAESVLTGAVGQQRVPEAFLADLVLPLPPLAEQRRTVAWLTGQLAVVERARGAAAERVAAAMRLSIAASASAFRESSSWPTEPLRSLCREDGQYGLSLPSSRDASAGVPMLRMGNVQDGRIDWGDLKYLSAEPALLEKYDLRDGDLVFNRTNSAELVGKTAVFHGTRRAVFASYLIRFRLDRQRANAEFVSSYINSRLGRAFIERRMARAVGQVNISASSMHEMPIPAPPISAQDHVVRGLQVVRRKATEAVAGAEKELTAIEALPAAILREAFDVVS